MTFILKNSDFFSASDRYDTLVKTELKEVVLCGRSNVGKSSLINALLQRKSLARVGKTPGSTQNICLYELNFKDEEQEYRGILSDLPGYGYAKVSHGHRALWSNTISRYLVEREALQAVVVLVDIRRDFGEEELELLKIGRSGGIVLCLTKADKIKRRERADRIQHFKDIAEIPEQSIIAVSTYDKEFRPAVSLLRETILSYLI